MYLMSTYARARAPCYVCVLPCVSMYAYVHRVKCVHAICMCMGMCTCIRIRCVTWNIGKRVVNRRDTGCVRIVQMMLFSEERIARYCTSVFNIRAHHSHFDLSSISSFSPSFYYFFYVRYIIYRGEKLTGR